MVILQNGLSALPLKFELCRLLEDELKPVHQRSQKSPHQIAEFEPLKLTPTVKQKVYLLMNVDKLV